MSNLIPEWAQRSLTGEALFALVILGGALVAALMVHPLVSRVAKFFTRKTKTTLDDLLIVAIQTPLFIFILIQGLYLAASSISVLDDGQGAITKTWLVIMFVLLMVTATRVMRSLITWYGQEIAVKTKSNLDEKLLPIVRRVLTVLIYVIGGLLILDNLGLELSPLIAGLGLGGLAVALALQPMLSNFIASAAMVSDQAISVGDFIELQGGPSGTVQDIGWRSTKIVTLVGNLVAIPNSKLADTIFTNYDIPTKDVAVPITCGIAYESDLSRVEQVALEVAQGVVDDLPDAVILKSFKPAFLFREFGESNINFVVVVKATDRVGSFRITHELVKRLHARFAKEGLVINYPVRKIVYAPSSGSKPDAASPKPSTKIVQDLNRGLQEEAVAGDDMDMDSDV
jgi:small-conductance mechanosensitive channel